MNDGMHLVEHVKRTEAGQTKMQIRLPISLRAGMAALSKRLGISQLALVRSALAAFLVANEAPVVPLVAPEVIAEAQPEEATEVIAEAQPEAQPRSHRGPARSPDLSTPTTGSYRSKCRTGCTASF